MEQHKRSSGIDVLRVIAIFMVVLCHSMPDSNGMISGSTAAVIDLNRATGNIQQIIILFLKNGGMVANNIFMLISSWFLLDNDGVKIKKVSRIIWECFFISVIIVVMLKLIGYSVPTTLFLKSFFPIWMNANWYITCYLILYLIHSALNCVINRLEKEKFLAVILSMGFFYGILQIIYKGSYYYNDLVGFIHIYFLAGYTKKFLTRLSSDRKINLIILILSFSIYSIMMVFLDQAGLRSSAISFYLLKMNTNANPLFILIAWSSFNLARNHRIKADGCGYIARHSMLIYILHRNSIINGSVKYSIFEYIKNRFSYDHILLWVIMYGTAIFFLSLIISIVCKKILFKYVHKWSDILLDKSGGALHRIISNLSHIE